LGSVTTLPGSVNFNSTPLYLGVKVGADSEMTPRIQLTTSPYSFNSDLLDGLDSSAFLQVSGGNINIGSGTVTSGAVNGISIGSTIQPTSAGGLTVQSNGANALGLDSGGAAGINIGGANANAITIGNATTNPNITFNGAGTFGTTSGAVSLNGNTTIPGIKTLTVSGGLTTLGAGLTFSGTAARTITGPSTGGLTVSVASGPLALSTTTSGALSVTSAGALSLTGAAASSWDIGANTLSLQTASNGGITTGTGTLTQGGNVTFSGTSARSLTGPSTGGLTVNVASGPLTISTTTSGTLALTSAGALNMSGAAASAWDIGNNTLSLQTTNNGAITTGTGLFTQGGNLTFNGTSARTITGPSTGGLTLTVASGPLTLSTTTSGTLSIQGSGGVAITSGANITLGTSDGTATLFVFDAKNTTGDPTAVNGGEYYNSANNKFRCAQNSIWSDCISGFNTITKSADQAATQSSTTMQNDTALVFTANANTTYVFDAWIPVNDSNATADLKYTFTTPASSTLNIMTNYYSTATANVFCNIIASGTACANATINIANHFIQVRGQVTVAGTAGSVQLQFAQNTATAASFPVVKKGATLTWHQSN
jgi:hypothetical protein